MYLQTKAFDRLSLLNHYLAELDSTDFVDLKVTTTVDPHNKPVTVLILLYKSKTVKSTKPPKSSTTADAGVK